MKRLKTILVIFIILLTSCTREFEKELHFGKQVVVNSVLMAGSPVIVGLHFSVPVNEMTTLFDPQFVENAYVEISDSHGNSFILDTTSDYKILPPLNGIIETVYYQRVYYTAQLIPQEGEEYFLRVYVPGFDTIYAQTTIPLSPDTGKFWYKITFGPPISEAEIGLEIKNTGGYNYYWLETAEYFNHLSCNDPAAITTNSTSLINGEFFPDHSYTLYFKASIDTMLQDTAVFYLFRVSREFYYYFKSYEEQTPPEIPNPYQEPVVVYSNIRNGLGIFTSFSKPVFLKIPLKNTKK